MLSESITNRALELIELNPEMDVLDAVKESIIEENKMIQELHEQKTERAIKLKNAMCKNVYALIHLKNAL